MTAYRSLTNQQLDDSAKEAARGNGVLDRMLSEAMFGGKPPRRWKDWPDDAKEAWDAAVHLWTYYTRGRWMGRAKPLDLDEAWTAIMESAELEPKERYSWPDLAVRLRTLPRKVEYQLSGRLHFEFTGRPPNRRLVRGPCLYCGTVVAAEILNDGVCAVCLEDPAAGYSERGVGGGQFAPGNSAQAWRDEPDTRIRTKIVAVTEPGRIAVQAVTHVHRKLG